MTKNLLLVTIDALRADHTGHHGYDRPTTPRLDALADEGIVFDRAIAHGPTTFTAVPSLLAARHALEHPDYPHLPTPSIAGALRTAGYHTLAVNSNAWLSPTYGYDREFDAFRALGRGPRSATGWWDNARHRIGAFLDDEGLPFRTLKGLYDRTRETTDRSEEAIVTETAVEHVNRDEPTFTWAHYMTAHAPYAVDTEVGAAFVDDPPGIDEQRELNEAARETTPPGEERSLLVDLYDSAIRHVDRRVSELVEAIDRERTAVIVTADHGEAFWEHGYYEHPPELHEELLHVPLIVLPATDAGVADRVEHPVGLNAIPSTLAELADAPVDAATFAEPSLTAHARGEADAAVVRSAVAHDSRTNPEGATGENLRVAVRDGAWKLVAAPNRDGEPTLYDLRGDPAERSNVADEHPDRVRRLTEHATAFADQVEVGGGFEAPPEVRDRLDELGYLDGG